ncbi:hypothetical protein H257_00270 [Aphanomyces astaci]|uniref:Myosin motor domain-containing protein n=1 Tax=Aphanomyces astaci TaxID=112090 RepID=W4H9R0_APHAT|nr:hypothetical protein H257_00270 [Aphanomyces astaci]ETV88760.1 hypothetical protein H257_00270 [Aphanomyces astaci]|eukprot:XP_009821160.1 hypothetical protein H257_00270 [Aphanomyces astaci]
MYRDDHHDLADRAELSEAALVQLIESRFRRNLVYTHAGSVLLAVNPFRRIEDLYGQDMLQEYESPNAAPHIYGVAANAYRAMQLMHSSSSNQTILISGDSGSGKTECTKRMLDYFVHVGRSSDTSSERLTRHIVAANVVLEAFGNAQTLRNSNSSRFGKFIQLDFSGDSHRLFSASIQTYLLETVRIVNPAAAERNYHVFYALLSGAPSSLLATWQLVPSPTPTSSTLHGNSKLRGVATHTFRYIPHPSSSNSCKQNLLHDDSAMFTALETAMTSLGLPATDVYRVVAVVLHLGNVSFDETNSSVSTHAMAAAAALLQVPLPDLQAALTTRALVVANEVQVLSLSAVEAAQARDGMAKALYARLFEWLVEHINGRLNLSHPSTATSPSSWIAVLDMFGFEHFGLNSFEQLCINYTNEVLHQHFVQHVFKLDAAEYAAEGLACPLSTTPYVDNEDCIALFSAKHTGLFALLDEECVLARGSDAAFASKLHKEHATRHPRRFTASHGQLSQRKFTIHHYAGSVEYTAVGFRDKNFGVLAPDVVELLRGRRSTDAFVRQLFQSSSPSRHNKPRRHESVASQFQSQLGTLMKRLHTAQVHYVRCLKPNDAADPALFLTDRLRHQLRCHGILDAIRIAQLGFPVRLSHAAFQSRYRPLLHRQQVCDEDSLHDLINALVTYYGDATSDRGSNAQRDGGELSRGTLHRQHIQVGRTKVFMQAAVHKNLEVRRARVELRAASVLTHAMQSFVYRRRFQRLRQTAVWCQRHVRRVQSQRRHHNIVITRLLREKEAVTAAATTIQSVVRRMLARRQYVRHLHCVVVLQVWWIQRLLRRRRLEQGRQQDQTLPPSPPRVAASSIIRSSWAPNSEEGSFSDGMLDVLWRSSPPATSLDPDAARPRTFFHHKPTSPSSSRAWTALPPLTLVDPATLPPLADYFSCSGCTKRFTLVFRRKFCCLSCRHVVCSRCCNVVGIVAGKKARVCLVCAALHRTTDNCTARPCHSQLNQAMVTEEKVWHRPWPEPPLPDNEMSRLAAVARLNIDDVRHDMMIQHMCTMVYHTWPGAVAFVGIMGKMKQVMVTSVGSRMFPDQLPRDMAFCAHTICGTKPLVVMDATKDPRFMHNPLVKADRRSKKFCFYLGAAVVDLESRHILGTIAVLHTISRKDSVQKCELQVLENYARVVSRQLTMNMHGWRPSDISS